MNWELYRSVMEQYAIKKDDMSTEDAYFMATHMPFSSLELFIGGYYEPQNMPAPSRLMSEDEVFEKLIHNPDNEHRMIIVRGEAGSGKSHLIRYLKGKYERSPSTVYDRNTEQLVFLRRLNNSVRGAFSQLLEQGAVRTPELEEKLRKFVESSDSKDEYSFKTDILHAYIAAVQGDTSNKIYKAPLCLQIASYLSDSRVMNHLLREGGPICKCYALITAPSNQILQDTTVFSTEDFSDKKLIKSVKTQGDPRASSWALRILDDKDEIAKLVNYLNTLTRDVIQRCANISSENAETIFAQLRKDLKKQGKNLTIFIEDFTGFTGIDQELITALSYEHGGDYSDLCRVTSVIGITSEYYFLFQGNFKERVTHQVVVSERSYSSNEFLIQMAGRYLNAIYCDPERLKKWNKDGADLSDLPLSGFAPPFQWDSTDIGGQEVTLYPFNRRSLPPLFNMLGKKTPRMFLQNVIRAQLKEYFDGKQYGEDWYFPLNSGNIRMENDPHISAIDRMEHISFDDRNRLKTVFAVWGDGSAAGIRDENGTLWYGGVNQAFLADIGLNAFTGIGEVEGAAGAVPSPAPQAAAAAPKATAPVDNATKDYLKFKDDIEAWYSGNGPLKYDEDYRKWLRTLVRGDKQPGAINWQDSGVPAYVAHERLADLRCYYIESQRTSTGADKPIVYMDRSTESRDALMALNEFNHKKSWDFEGAAYYQQRLITWLERRKSKIIENVTAVKPGEDALPVLEWCLAIQYLKACILGQKVNTSSPLSAVQSLFKNFNKDDSIERDTREWNDMIQFVLNRKADFDAALAFLKQAAATTMGAVYFSADPSENLCYRADELITAAEKLIATDWDIESTLPASIPQNNLLYNPAALLKALYTSVKKAMAAETRNATNVKKQLEAYVGELTQANLVSTLSAVQSLFGEILHGWGELRIRYDKPPIETAATVLEHLRQVEGAAANAAVKQLSTYSANSLHALYGFLRDMQAIARKAEYEEAEAKKALAKIGGAVDTAGAADAALDSLRALYTQLENMEVCENAVN